MAGFTRAALKPAISIRSILLHGVLAVGGTMMAFNLGYYIIAGQLIPAPTKEKPKHPFIHEGYLTRGACDLQSIKQNNETVDLAMFPKHGIHVTEFIPDECHRLQKKVVRSFGSADEFVHSGGSHKILPVRDQASYYRSVFNHVCSKRTRELDKFRKEHNIDCRRDLEFMKLMHLNKREIAWSKSPFLMKEVIMRRKEIDRVMLVDYQCIPKVVNAICDTPMKSYEEMNGEERNSAAGQGYKDYWSMHNWAPYAPFQSAWDDVYASLAESCCLELVKQGKGGRRRRKRKRKKRESKKPDTKDEDDDDASSGDERG